MDYCLFFGSDKDLFLFGIDIMASWNIIFSREKKNGFINRKSLFAFCFRVLITFAIACKLSVRCGRKKEEKNWTQLL